MDPLNVTIVALLFAAVAFVEWADKHDLLARLADKARVRLGRRVPTGMHRIDGQVGFHFGQDDSILVLRLPIATLNAGKPVRYIGATDAGTRFTVNHEPCTPDALLAAYDDSLGPLEIVVSEPGRIDEIGIASKDG